jgi:ubiquinone/menaquinone biosynthesis C-methylase UbiE
LEDGSIDAAVIILALQNIENMQAVIAEAARVLKTGGRFVFVINHPAFRIPQKSDWDWDKKLAMQFRKVFSYMSDDSIKIDMTPGEKVVSKKKYTVSFHRPLQSYVKALAKNGFGVVRLEEWISHKKSQTGPRAEEEDRTRKEIPMFLCIEARKM